MMIVIARVVAWFTAARFVRSLRPLEGEAWLFAANFLKHPGQSGSIVPSSAHLVDQVLREIDWSKAEVVVEYGPGVGTFTGELLRRMPHNARLIVIEANADFVQHLRARLTDPRLHVEHGSAAHVLATLRRLGLSRACHVVSGIPLGSMPPEVRLEICEASRAVLQPEGALLVYQFTPRVLPQLRQTFARVQCGFVWRNMPPARYYVCRNSEPATCER
jgi:phospholipid N-methyltransferase